MRHELVQRGDWPDLSFLADVSRGLPVLGEHTAVRVEIYRAQRQNEGPWFSSAMKFLEGYGQPASDFEKCRLEIRAKLSVEIERFEQAEAERNALILERRLKAENERKKLIGGLGGINGDPNSSSDFWGRVDSEHWREQE